MMIMCRIETYKRLEAKLKMLADEVGQLSRDVGMLRDQLLPVLQRIVNKVG
jgi:archaellum component FlaC